MKRAEFEKIKQQYDILDSEVKDVINFVSELLYRKAREIEKNEPYATKTIADFDKAAYEAWDLIDYIANIEEE